MQQVSNPHLLSSQGRGIDSCDLARCCLFRLWRRRLGIANPQLPACIRLPTATPSKSLSAYIGGMGFPLHLVIINPLHRSYQSAGGFDAAEAKPLHLRRGQTLGRKGLPPRTCRSRRVFLACPRYVREVACRTISWPALSLPSPPWTTELRRMLA
jgi:hypothetical protein